MNPINLIVILLLCYCLFVILSPKNYYKKIFKPKIKKYPFNNDLIFFNKVYKRNKEYIVVEKSYRFGKIISFKKK